MEPRIKIYRGDHVVVLEIGENQLKIELTPYMARQVGEGLFKTGCLAEQEERTNGTT